MQFRQFSVFYTLSSVYIHTIMHQHNYVSGRFLRVLLCKLDLKLLYMYLHGSFLINISFLYTKRRSQYMYVRQCGGDTVSPSLHGTVAFLFFDFLWSFPKVCLKILWKKYACTYINNFLLAVYIKHSDVCFVIVLLLHVPASKLL